jgi:hypothetical protein
MMQGCEPCNNRLDGIYLSKEAWAEVLSWDSDSKKEEASI